MWLSPLKHPQYLIPAAVFIAWYVADGVFLLWEPLSRFLTGRILFAALYCIGGYLLVQVFYLVHEPKLNWTNEQDITRMQAIFVTIPKGAYVLDLEGRTMYYPYPYYACCVPFGQFDPFLSRPLPSLAQALERTKTRYIYQAGINRVSALLPDDQAFIAKHYKPENNGELLVSQDW